MIGPTYAFHDGAHTADIVAEDLGRPREIESEGVGPCCSDCGEPGELICAECAEAVFDRLAEGD